MDLNIKIDCPALSELARAIEWYAEAITAASVTPTPTPINLATCEDSTAEIAQDAQSEATEPEKPTKAKTTKRTTKAQKQAEKQPEQVVEPEQTPQVEPETPTIAQQDAHTHAQPQNVTVEPTEAPATIEVSADEIPVTVDILANAGAEFLNEHPDGIPKLQALLAKYEAKNVRGIPADKLPAFAADFAAIGGRV